VESVFFMVRSSSVFLFVALLYRKDRASTGAGQKIICKSWIWNGKSRREGMAAHHSETLGMTLFLNKRSIRGERNIQKRHRASGRKDENKQGSGMRGKGRAEACSL
jgi:hypothetical protein